VNAPCSGATQHRHPPGLLGRTAPAAWNRCWQQRCGGAGCWWMRGCLREGDHSTGKDGSYGQATIDFVAPGGGKLIGNGGGNQLNLADAGACRKSLYEFQTRLGHSALGPTRRSIAPNQNQTWPWRWNASAPGGLCRSPSLNWRKKLLQVSTDFVFNGAQGHPYEPAQPWQPLGSTARQKAGR